MTFLLFGHVACRGRWRPCCFFETNKSACCFGAGKLFALIKTSIKSRYRRRGDFKKLRKNKIKKVAFVLFSKNMHVLIKMETRSTEKTTRHSPCSVFKLKSGDQRCRLLWSSVCSKQTVTWVVSNACMSCFLRALKASVPAMSSFSFILLCTSQTVSLFVAYTDYVMLMTAWRLSFISLHFCCCCWDAFCACGSPARRWLARDDIMQPPDLLLERGWAHRWRRRQFHGAEQREGRTESKRTELLFSRRGKTPANLLRQDTSSFLLHQNRTLGKGASSE